MIHSTRTDSSEYPNPGFHASTGHETIGAADYLLFDPISTTSTAQQHTSEPAWSPPSTTASVTSTSGSEHSNPRWPETFADSPFENKAAHASTNDLIAEFLQDFDQDSVAPSADGRKPGRKPIFEDNATDKDEDPKLKRKAQNRAAQRAFRERKERYVRDLEIKIKHVQDRHAYTTSQLSQENRFLRNVIHHLEAQVRALKGETCDNMNTVAIPPLPSDPLTTTPLASLAPFLTISTPAHSAQISPPMPILPSPYPQQPILPSSYGQSQAQSSPRVRPVAIAPARTESSLQTAAFLSERRPLAPKRDRGTGLAQCSKKPKSRQTKKNPDQKSPVAMYVTFSPQNMHSTLAENQETPSRNDCSSNFLSDPIMFEDPSYSFHQRRPVQTETTTAVHVSVSQSQGSASAATETPVTQPVASVPPPPPPRLLPRPAPLQSRASGSTGNSNGSGSRSAQMSASSAPASDDKEKNSDAESINNERMQLVWRRLNLYGRFADFNFDQICKVASMRSGIDNNGPLLEDWELDKIMHQMDPDHL